MVRRAVSLPLGEDFHARRPSIRASQVGVVARSRRHRRTNSERRDLAVSLLRDPLFDAVLTGESPFAELPEVLEGLENRELDDLCHGIAYSRTRRQVTVRRRFMIAHSLPREFLGPVQGVHGASFVAEVTFRGRS